VRDASNPGLGLLRTRDAPAPCVAFPLPFSYGPSQRHDMVWDIMLLSWWASWGHYHKFRLGHLSKFHLGSPQVSQESPGFTMVCVGPSLAVFHFGDLWLAEVKPVPVGYIIVSIAASFFLCYSLMFVLFMYVLYMLVNCYVMLSCRLFGFAAGFHLDSGPHYLQTAASLSTFHFKISPNHTTYSLEHIMSLA
jgi:hypothetical protein